MTSIRGTLTATLVAGVTVSTLLAGVLVHDSVHHSLIRDFDLVTLERARTLSKLLEVEDGNLEFEYSRNPLFEFENRSDPEYFEIRGIDGARIARSTHLPADVALSDASATIDSPSTRELVLPSGNRGRATTMRVTLAPDDDDYEDGEAHSAPSGSSRADVRELAITVARSTEPIEQSLRAVLRALATAGALLVAAVLVLVHGLVRRGLRPLGDLAQRVTTIDADTLADRLPVERLPTELQLPATKLNELLARLELAFDRERRMTANLAHELRTPVAELKTATDVAMRWPDDHELARTAIASGAAIATRMGELVVGLLRLARIQSGIMTPEWSDVDLRALVDEVYAWHAPAAQKRRLVLQHSTPPATLLRTDRTLLSMAISNLLDNAVRFAEEGSSIDCSIDRAAAGSLQWILRNRTMHLREGDVEHMVEPFWQADAARSDRSHVGLGLSIVDAITRVLGLRLHLASNGMFEARIELLATTSV